MRRLDILFVDSDRQPPVSQHDYLLYVLFCGIIGFAPKYWRNGNAEACTFNFMAPSSSTTYRRSCVRASRIYPRSKSSTMHAHRRNAVGTASSWMDGKLFQLQFPNRHFLFCHVYIWTGEHKHHKYQLLSSRTSTRALNAGYGNSSTYVYSFYDAASQIYTLWIINDRVELSIELSWRWVGACARKTIFLCIKLWNNFSYFSSTSSSSITLAIELRSTCARQISKSDVQYGVCLCVIRVGVTMCSDEMRNQNSLDSRESTVRHLRGVHFSRYESTFNWWIISNSKWTLFLRHVLNLVVAPSSLCTGQ